MNVTLLGNLFQLQHISKLYENAIYTGGFDFEFTSDEIQLVLEPKQMKDNWIISPQSYPCTVRITLWLSRFNIIPIWLLACNGYVDAMACDIYHTVSNSHQSRINVMIFSWVCVSEFRQLTSIKIWITLPFKCSYSGELHQSYWCENSPLELQILHVDEFTKV